MVNSKHLKQFRKTVDSVKNRLEKGRARGQVELHLDLNTVSVLVGLSNGVLKALEDNHQHVQEVLRTRGVDG